MSLKSEIWRYILENSGCAETKEGVARVWLNLPNSDEALIEVERTLDEFVAEGILERHRLPGGAAIYRRGRLSG